MLNYNLWVTDLMLAYGFQPFQVKNETAKVLLLGSEGHVSSDKVI